MQSARRRLLDSIIELKSLCRFEEEIGEECGLAPREVSCLAAMAAGESLSAGELASRMGLSASRASRLIAALRRKRFLRETFDDRDRRSVSLSLTRAGERLAKKVELKKEECEKRLRGSFTRGQLRTIRTGLDTLRLAFGGRVHGRTPDS